MADQRLEIHDLLPVAAPVEQDRDRAGDLPGLGQGQNLAQFVQGSEAAGNATIARSKWANQSLRVKK